MVFNLENLFAPNLQQPSDGSLSDTLGDASGGLLRALLAIGSGGATELASAKLNAEQDQATQANQVAGGSQIPAFAYNEESPDQIAKAKSLQLANLGTAAGNTMFQQYNNNPDQQLSQDEKKALIQNYQSEIANRNYDLEHKKNEDSLRQNTKSWESQNIVPDLFTAASTPQGPTPSGAPLPTIPAGITTDPDKLMQAASKAYLIGDTNMGDALMKQTVDQSTIAKNNAKAAKDKASATGTAEAMPTDATGQPLTGQAYAQAIDPVRTRAAMNLLQGRGIVPTGTYAKSPAGQQLLNDALAIDPTFDATEFKKRASTNSEFASGAQGKNIASIETAINTLSQLKEISDKLGGPTIGNSIRNAALSAGSDPTLAQYHNVAKNAADETSKAIAGGNPSAVSDRENRLAAFTPDQAPGARNAVLQSSITELMNRLTPLTQEYNTNMGPLNRKEPTDFLSSTAKKNLAKIMGEEQSTPQQKAQDIQQNTPAVRAVYTRGSNGQLIRHQ